MLKKKNILIISITFGIIFIFGITLQLTKKKMIFQKYVYNPIPKSVKNLKIDRPWEASGHRYVMRFKIDKEDIKLLFNSKPFEQMQNRVTYENGQLVWELDDYHSEGITLYMGSLSSGPNWFKPQDWNDIKVYRFKEIFGTDKDREHIQLLIFNETISEAYFLEYQEGIW